MLVRLIQITARQVRAEEKRVKFLETSRLVLVLLVKLDETLARALEPFSIRYHKTKTKVIAVNNHKEHNSPVCR